MITTLIICCTIAFCTLCITIYNVRKVSADVYQRVLIDDSLPKSPYSLIRTKNREGQMGYSITKEGKIIYIPGTGDSQYEVYGNLNSVMRQINILEKVEGYRLTTVD